MSHCGLFKSNYLTGRTTIIFKAAEQQNNNNDYYNPTKITRSSTAAESPSHKYTSSLVV